VFWTRGIRIGLLPFGQVVLVLANLVVLLVLCLYKFDLGDKWEWEDVGYRTGFISVCQLPLILLLAGKKNIIGYLTGSSYERLNWLHRWAARCLLLTVIIHMGYWLRDWAQYDYISTKIATDSITQRGLGAGSVLLWIVLSSMMPIRGWSYEIFLVQHVVSFVALIVMVYLHVPSENHIWIWIPIGLYLFDRTVRALNMLYINFWTRPLKADFAPLAGNVTRVTIRNPPISWRPGQHMFLSCHSLLPFQSHPFTISSLPSDGKMEFLIRAQVGGTKRFFRHAEVLPPHNQSKRVLIEGPYGRVRPLQQFDTVTMIAGGMGASFVIPLLRDLVQQRPTPRFSRFQSRVCVVARRVRFVWVVRSRGQLTWFKSQLEELVRDSDMVLDISFFVTCDESMAGESSQYEDSEKRETLDNDIKKEGKYSVNEVRSSSSSSSSIQSSTPPIQTCGPNGTCCCRHETNSSIEVICQCNGSIEFEKTGNVPIKTGRPPLRDLIRTDIEHAKGESAIVCCGPREMARDVRQFAASLSDERATHKGSGAQGIWCFVEGFCY
jgi:NAD(P)H-flavin reductase